MKRYRSSPLDTAAAGAGAVAVVAGTCGGRVPVVAGTVLGLSAALTNPVTHIHPNKVRNHFMVITERTQPTFELHGPVETGLAFLIVARDVLRQIGQGGISLANEL